MVVEDKPIHARKQPQGVPSQGNGKATTLFSYEKSSLGEIQTHDTLQSRARGKLWQRSSIAGRGGLN